MAKVKLELWDEEKTRIEILKRYKAAAKAKEKYERQWRENESAVYGSGRVDLSNLTEDIDSSSLRMDVSVISKNVRFIHAQMSANPPSVQMRPATSDQDDQRKAAAADVIARYATRKYILQEKFDQLNLSTIIRGTGILKTIHDPTKGEILSYDLEKQEIELEGDIIINPVSPYNIFPDPDATCTPEIKWVIEKIYMDFDEALIQFPHKKKELEATRLSKNEADSILYSSQQSKDDKRERFNTVELLEYWETGLASNGYMGRYCLTTNTGNPLIPCEVSPFSFKGSGVITQILKDENLSEEEKERQIENAPEKASLPYHILTDVDVPESIWGASVIDRALNLQDKLEKIDSTYLDNIAAHGSVKLVVPESATIDDEMTNSPWDIVKIPGNQPPYHLSVPQLMPEMSLTRTNIITGINDAMGVNESMFGQQSREQSSVTMQFATNQGSMVRRRIFNKSVLITESVFRAILNLARKHWMDGKVLSVVGRENALESREFKSVDIDGGYDVVGEYGGTFSLDPITRRNEIIQMSGIYREAGIPMRSLLKFMRMSEVQSLHDELEYAESRQREIFEIIIASGQPVVPKEQMDHENMIAYALKYFMTAEFNSLPEEIQALCKQHNRDRISLAAQERAGITGQEAISLAAPEGAAPVEQAVAPAEEMAPPPEAPMEPMV